MTDYSKALGQVVQDLRKEKGLTQVQLGHAAGYTGGAGVSISRLENDLLLPGPELFAGVARELGISTDKLDALAKERAKILQSAIRDVSIKDRVARIGRENEGRKQLVTALEAFYEARDRAKDDFLMRFREIAARVDGPPQPDPTPLGGDDIPDGDDVEAEAAYQIQFTRYGVEQALAGTAADGAAGAAIGAAAYIAFAEAVALGTASMGGDIPGLTGVAAALRGFGAAMGVRRPAVRVTAGSASANALLAGLVAGTVAVALG